MFHVKLHVKFGKFSSRLARLNRDESPITSYNV